MADSREGPALSPEVCAALDDISQGIYACVRRKRKKRAEAAEAERRAATASAAIVGDQAAGTVEKAVGPAEMTP